MQPGVITTGKRELENTQLRFGTKVTLKSIHFVFVDSDGNVKRDFIKR